MLYQTIQYYSKTKFTVKKAGYINSEMPTTKKAILAFLSDYNEKGLVFEGRYETKQVNKFKELIVSIGFTVLTETYKETKGEYELIDPNFTEFRIVFRNNKY